MVERYKRSKGKKPLLDNHQKCWIWGRHAVLEILRAGRWDMHEILLSDSVEAETIDEVHRLADAAEIPVEIVAADKLTATCRSSEHQGLVAKMCPFPYADVNAFLEGFDSGFLMVLDQIQDPYNFGAIIRSCDVFGATGILIGETGQVGVTSMVARSSAGAVAHVPVCRVPDPVSILRKMAASGIQILVTDADGQISLPDCDFGQPTAVIIGNEGKGVSPQMREVATATLSIPQFGMVGSLNAAQAASIICYEARRLDRG